MIPFWLFLRRLHFANTLVIWLCGLTQKELRLLAMFVMPDGLNALDRKAASNDG